MDELIVAFDQLDLFGMEIPVVPSIPMDSAVVAFFALACRVLLLHGSLRTMTEPAVVGSASVRDSFPPVRPSVASIHVLHMCFTRFSPLLLFCTQSSPGWALLVVIHHRPSSLLK